MRLWKGRSPATARTLASLIDANGSTASEKPAPKPWRLGPVLTILEVLAMAVIVWALTDFFGEDEE